MNLEKSKKRIAKKIKMGFQGFPEINIAYSGPNESEAQKVALSFILEEGHEPMIETFQSNSDAREDEVIQSAIVKVIERSGAKTVRQKDGISVE